jgi:hypothetical protein
MLRWEKLVTRVRRQMLRWERAATRVTKQMLRWGRAVTRVRRQMLRWEKPVTRVTRADAENQLRHDAAIRDLIVVSPTTLNAIGELSEGQKEFQESHRKLLTETVDESSGIEKIDRACSSRITPRFRAKRWSNYGLHIELRK